MAILNELLLQSRLLLNQHVVRQGDRIFQELPATSHSAALLMYLMYDQPQFIPWTLREDSENKHETSMCSWHIPPIRKFTFQNLTSLDTYYLHPIINPVNFTLKCISYIHPLLFIGTAKFLVQVSLITTYPVHYKSQFLSSFENVHLLIVVLSLTIHSLWFACPNGWPKSLQVLVLTCFLPHPLSFSHWCSVLLPRRTAYPSIAVLFAQWWNPKYLKNPNQNEPHDHSELLH